MDNMVFAVWVSGRLQFSADDRRACFAAAKALVDIAQDVRSYGLLSIDGKISACTDFFMRTALQLAVDSAEPAMLRELMQDWIIFGDYRSAELLRRILMLDGVIAIINGWNPLQIKENFGAFFGEDLNAEWEAYYKAEQEKATAAVKVEAFCKSKQAVEGLNLLGILLEFDDRAVQLLMRCVHQPDVILSLWAASGDVARRILVNVSQKIARILMEEVSHLSDVRASDVTAAQDRILAKLKELEERGEIIFAK